MGKMLIRVPRMYTEAEFKNFLKVLPDDFEEKSNEFWSYVDEKLAGFVGKVQRVYRDGICVQGDEALKQLVGLDVENFKIVKKLVDAGASFEVTEVALLVAESENWQKMLTSEQSNQTVLEMFEDTMKERDSYVSKRVNETLQDDECGVLFMDPSRTVNLNEKIKVIIMFRFNPLDYLKSWQVRLKLKAKEA
jgi:hypothetical protein